MPLDFEKADLGSFGINEEDTGLNASVSEAVKVNPDQHVEVTQLSKESGVPAFAVENDPAAVKDQLKFDNIDLSGMSQRSPNTAKYLTDFDNAAIAHDDIDVMESIEGVLTSTREYGYDLEQAFEKGQKQVESSEIGLSRMYQALGVGEAVSDEQIKRLKQIEAQTKPHADEYGFFTGAPVTAAEQLPILYEILSSGIGYAVVGGAAGAAIGAATGGIPTAGTGAIPGAIAGAIPGAKTGGRLGVAKAAFDLEAGLAFNEFSLLKDESGKFLNPDITGRAAVIVGGVNAGLEFISLAAMGRTVTPVMRSIIKSKVKSTLATESGRRLMMRLMKDYGVAVGTEYVTELAQEFSNVVGAELSKYADKDAFTEQDLSKSLDNIFSGKTVKRVTQAGTKGAQAALIFAGAGTATSAVVETRQRERLAESEQVRLDTLNNELGKSKLKERDKDSFKQFVEQVDGDNNTNIFIDGAQTSLYLQTKTEEEIAADPALTLLREGTDEAAALGGQIEIPVAEFSTEIAGTDHFTELRDSMTMSDGTVAPFRQEQAQQETDAYVSSLMAEANENASQYVEAQEIYETVRSQLIDSGQVNTANASIMAQVVPAWATAQAALTGKTVQQVYQDSGLVIEGPLTGEQARLEGEQVLLQAEPAFKDAPTVFNAARDKFLEVLPEDATSEEVIESVVEFKPEYRNFIKALERDDWLGFDFPSQAVSAALSEELENFEVSPGLKQSIGRMVNAEADGMRPFEQAPVEDQVGVTTADIQTSIREEFEGVKLNLMGEGQTVTLSKIVVPEDQRDSGVGTEVMNRVTDWADANGKTVALSPSKDFGGTIGRLKDFYKRLGFVENKGKNKDLEISESMYRPAEAVEVLEQAPVTEQTETPEFKKWSGGGEVVEFEDINEHEFKEDTPTAVRVYHGTTHDFSVFDALRGNLEGQFGAVNYFTSSEHDASENYAGEGPDLTSRIDQRAEQIEYDIQEVIDGESLEAAVEQFIPGADQFVEDASDIAQVLAKQELTGGKDQTMELFVRVDNPFVIGENAEWIEFVDNESIQNDAIEQVAEDNNITVEELNENIDEYEDAIDEKRWEIESETPNKLIEAIQTVSDRNGVDASNLAAEVYDLGSEAKPDAIEDLMRSSEDYAYAEGDTGGLIGHQLVGEVIEEMGFDSIILKNAEQRFETMSMEPGTAHVHVFDSGNTNIKSVDNQGTFDPTDPDIFKQPTSDGAPGARGYYDPANSVIRLTEAADLSTFLHEFAHFMYEMEKSGNTDMLQGINNWYKRNAADVAKEANTYLGEKFDAEKQLEQPEFCGACDRLRRADTGEEFWQTMMSSRVEISEVDFVKSVDVNESNLLDEGETWEDYKSGLSDEVKFFEADNAFFFQTAGFEFIWDKKTDAVTFAQPTTPPTGKAGSITEADITTYLDNKTTGDTDKDSAIRRAVHEQFARGFEAYLMEGKAPSIELRNAFRTFARWLSQIYQTLRGKLNVDLDAEMRQVFDRLLATEEQIAAAEARARIEPMFTDAVMAGMTEEEFADYQQRQSKVKDVQTETLRDKLIKQLTRQTKAWWKAEKRDVYDEELEVLKTEQVHVAREQLKNGDLKLDFATVKEMIGEQKTDKRGRKSVVISPKLRGMTAKEHQGLHPDEAAAVLGYQSGSEMLDDLINAPSIGESADLAAERRMVERHGDILTDGTIEREADEAVQSEERGKLLLHELKMLARGTNAPTSDLTTIKAIATNRIGKLSFRQIHPGKYRSAEIKAANEAGRMLAEGNKEGAAAAKLKQTLNYYLGMEATAAKNGTVKILDNMTRYNKKKVQIEIMKSNGGHWEQIVGVLERFEFRKSATLKQVESVNENINTWAKNRMENEGDGLVLSNAVLNESYITHWKNVPYSDLQGINDSVKNIEHVARYSNKIKMMEEEIEFKKLKGDWVESIETNEQRFERKDSKSRTADSRKATASEHVRRWAAQLTKIPFLASWLDGGERVGLSHQILIQPLTDALDAKLKLIDEVATPVNNAIRDRSKADQKRHMQKIWIPEINDHLMGHQILAVALNVGNAGNLRKLLLGEGWADPDVDTDISIDNPQLQAVLQHMTETDWELVQLIWDQMEILYPQLAEVHRKTTGLTPPKVVATPVKTKFGTFKGGYFPVKYSPTRSHKAEKNAEKRDAETESMFNNTASIQASVNAGATNERTGFYDRIHLSLDVVSDHFNETIHYVTHHEAVRQINRLIQSSDVANAISGVLGESEFKQLKPWLNDVAKDGRQQPTKTFIDEIFQRLRFGTTLGVMGFKASTGIMQFFGLFTTAAELGVGPTVKGIQSAVGRSWYMKALRNTLGSTDDMQTGWDFAVERSKVLQHRTKTMDREIRNAMTRLKGERGIIAATQEVSMKHIALIQTYMVDLPTWLAAYDKTVSETGDEVKAAQTADFMVESLQGSGNTKDMAAIVRNQSKVITTFTMFMTFFSSLGNLSRDVVKGTKTGQYSPTSVAAKLMFLYTIPVFLEMLMRGQLDEPDGEDDRLGKYVTQVALYPLTSIPFVRDVASGLLGDFGYNSSPVSSMIEKGISGAKGITNAVFTDKEITKSQIKNVSKLTGAALGIPGVSQMWSTGEHLYDVLEEGEDATVREFLFGPKRD